MARSMEKHKNLSFHALFPTQLRKHYVHSTTTYSRTMSKPRQTVGDTPLPGVVGYDMVYGVTQDIINFQFKFLHATFIPGTKTTYIPQSLDTRPKPGGPGIFGTLGAPFVAISIGADTNFKNIRLFLPVTNGTVVYRDDNDDLQSLSFNSWTLSFLVNIGKTEITPQNINTMLILDSVKQQLNALPSSVFQPYSLFLDLENANIITSLQVTGVDWSTVDPLVQEEVSVRLTFYFTKTVPSTGNPYIVGYPVHSKNPAVTDPLPFFAPTDIKFSTTANVQTPGLSTLNYLVTVNNRTPTTDPRAGIFSAPQAVAGAQGFSMVSADLFVNQYIEGIFLNEVQNAFGVSETFRTTGPSSWGLFHLPDSTTQQVGTDSGLIPINLTTTLSTVCAAVLSTAGDQVALTLTGQFSCQLDWNEDWGKLGNLWLATVSHQQPFTITLGFSGGTDGRIDVTVTVVKGDPVDNINKSTVAKISDAVLAVFDGPNGVGHAAALADQFASNLESAQLDSLAANITSGVNVLSKRVILPAGEIFSVASLHVDSSNNLVTRLTYNDSLPFHATPAPFKAPPAPAPFTFPKPEPSPYSTTINVPLTTTRKLTTLGEIQNATLTHLELAGAAGAAKPATPVTEVQDSIQMVVSTELMYQKISATPLNPAQRLQSLLDSSGNPILFSIGTDNLFYATYSTPQTSASSPLLKLTDASAQWNPILSMPTVKGLENATAQAFAAAQNPSDGSIYLVLAVTIDADTMNGDSRVFVSPPMPNDVTKSNWKTIGSSWVERPRPKSLSNVKVPIAKANLGTPGANGQDIPLLVLSTKTVTGTDHRFATHYLVDIDSSNTNVETLWTEYALPNDAATILDLAVGNHPIGDVPNSGFETRGTYALYKTAGGDTVLNFTTLLDTTFNQSFHFQLSVPADTQTIYAVTNSDSGFTDVYVGGGSQLGFFAASNQLSGSTSTPIGNVPNVAELAVSYAGDSVSIWALDSNNSLWRLQSDKLPSESTPISWSSPLVIRKDIAQITPIYNKAQNVQELITVDAKTSQPSHLVRDPTTTIWTQNLLPVASLDKLLTFPSYTTQIRINDAVGRGIPGQAAQLSADQFVSVVVNGEAYNVGNAPVGVSAGPSGKITIVQPVTSIESPYFHISFPNGTSPVTINPAAKVTDKLFAVKTKEDLMSAKDSLGNPVFSGASEDNLNTAASVINQLSAHQPSNNPRAFLSSSLRSTLNPVSTGAWGLSIRRGKATFVAGTQAKTLLQGSKLSATGIDPTASFGDFCEWFSNGVEDALDVTFEVIDDILTIGAKIAGAIIKFAIRTFVELIKAAAILVGKILGIDVSGFLAWLGALFDWDEIVRTGKCINNILTVGLVQVENQIQSFEPVVRQYFAQAKNNLKSLGPQVPSNSFSNNPINAPPDFSQVGTDVAKFASAIIDNPIVQFVEDKILNNGILNRLQSTISVDGLPDITTLINNFWTNVVQPALDELYKDGKTTFDDLNALFSLATGGQGIGNLSVLQVLERVGIDVLVLILDVIENIAVALLELAVDLLKVVGAFLDAQVNVPFFSALWKELIGSDFTLAGGACLIIAIPIHTALAGLTGKSKFFPDGFESFSWSQIEPFLHPPTASPSPNLLSAQLGVDLFWVRSIMPAINAAFSALYDGLTAYTLYTYQEPGEGEPQIQLGPLPVIMGILPVLALGSAITAIPECQGLYAGTGQDLAYGLQIVNCILKFVDFAKSAGLSFLPIKRAKNIKISDTDPFPQATGFLEVMLGGLVIITAWPNLATHPKQVTSTVCWDLDSTLDGIALGCAGGVRLAGTDPDPETKKIAQSILTIASCTGSVFSIIAGLIGAYEFGQGV
ncbi:hypothetical protein BD410DRAFT_795906 [Rickenella mellea]|uniref:Uncharacterized protein n=1 Tax=Rickenella mellea TaxID=50990 RepID=A0A4Y7PN71_9AGAM|nr:hypothetical protein BD410DRAFT_795906 [Rickenella mellea]